MKNTLFLFVLLLCLGGCSQEPSSKAIPQNVDYNSLRAEFQVPQQAHGVNCWWWWLNGNVTKEAITKDLEAMKSRNFQGAMIFDAGGHNQRNNKDIPAGPLYGSDAWKDLFVYALDEAKRLDLVLGFNIQSGWNLGGPCVTPEYAAKQITFSEISVSGESQRQIKLPLPKVNKGFYKDIAVLAFPTHPQQETDETITQLDYKLGLHEMGGSAPDCRFLLTNEGKGKEKKTGQKHYRIQEKDILNITDKMDSEGSLNWIVPQGDWKILRFGYTCTHSAVSTSSNDWQGNVLDYMSKDAFDYYWETVVDPILKAAGEHVGTTLKYMETDSWECGGMNWTDQFEEEFFKYCGYDLIQYLPIMAGHVVKDIDTSNAFLADFRKTLAHLVAHNHYARFASYAHQHDMGIQPESAGPHAGPLDGIKNYGYSDIVMSEFWAPSPHRPKDENRFFLKQASSAAHIYGKKIVAAESFTTIGPHWNDELWSKQKPSFDHEICSGLNRVYFHTFTCSPKEMGFPGQEYFAGTHINPQVTWWNQSGPFIDYLHRTQSLVQNGTFVADVLYYYGDHVPNVFPYKHSDPAGAMPGFDYDVTDETIFLQLKVADGKIIVPSGLSYRVLVLPDHRVLSLPIVKKIADLLHQGAHIIGYKPQKMVSLVGGASAQTLFTELCDQIWGETPADKGSRPFGKGTIAWGTTAREYLRSLHVPLDFNIKNNPSVDDFDYIHYTLQGSHIYFVSNQTPERKKMEAQFRVSKLQPELWNALNGEIREASAFKQHDGLTTVPLTLEPYGAIFVVFHKPIAAEQQGKDRTNDPDYQSLQIVKGPWEVSFDTLRGGPASIVFPELTDWTTHENTGIQYYSGPALYKQTFSTDFKINATEHYVMELGSVKDVGIAHVRINGIDKGILWTYPFRVDITKELKEKNNLLEIEITNSWYNRVAGDERSVGPRKFTNTNIVLGHDFQGKLTREIALEPSGLIGPVVIKKTTTAP